MRALGFRLFDRITVCFALSFKESANKNFKN